MVQGCVHNTLVLRITESMGSHWASRLATAAIARNRKGPIELANEKYHDKLEGT